MSAYTLAVVQMRVSDKTLDNLAKASHFVRAAAAQGAKVVLLPELFAGPYFCQLEREEYFAWAEERGQHSFLPKLQQLAAELGVVLPVSFFERAGPAYFNSLAMYDAGGQDLGNYRKSHIPDGPGYEEKYYFAPGDSGFKTWATAAGKIGVGICWDQWFPECARIMALRGADLLLYPTAIGSEPATEVATPNSPAMWRRAMLGHAVSNSCYVAAANRIGTEHAGAGASCDFYGHSFICDYRGEMLAEAGADYEGLLLARIDPAAAQTFRAGMGFFRDRRPNLYRALLSLDGQE